MARLIGYAGVLNEPRAAMGKLKTVEELFKGRHFDRDVVILCVRWYLRFKLSLRDLVEMMVERGLSMAHTTIMRWVQRYAPEFEKRWRRFARVVGRSWRVDETHVKIRGKWCYLYRAVDRAGRTVDFRLSARRNVAAAKAFFRKAIKRQQRCPQTITLDGYAASHRAVRELKAAGSLPANTKLRSSKYLNNLIEQDHRSVKQRIAVMLGFKGFSNAAITITGIELLHRIRTVQTATSRRSRSSCTCSLERSASSLKLHVRSKDCLLVLVICTRADACPLQWFGADLLDLVPRAVAVRLACRFWCREPALSRARP